MEPVVMAGTLFLLIAVAMLPCLVVVGLLLAALRSFLDAKPWLHGELPAGDARAMADRRIASAGHPDRAGHGEGTPADDVPRARCPRPAAAGT